GVWRTAALRRAVDAAGGPTSLRRVIAPLTVGRYRPAAVPGTPPPWTDCDTPADLARARAAAAGEKETPPVPPPPVPPPPSPSLIPRFQSPPE
ncbi:MAG TPA: hypothetical protein VNC79_12890, partial [Mycobacteriales bacterium]|nr:hypothetical protein [Mycobacteriales bacterium]